MTCELSPLRKSSSPIPHAFQGFIIVYGNLYCSQAAFAKYIVPNLENPYEEGGGGMLGISDSDVGNVSVISIIIELANATILLS